MPSLLLVIAVVVPTALLALLLRFVSRKRVDSILLLVSGAASLILGLVASNAMQVSTSDHMMSLEMSEISFNIGFLPPVFIVATLTVMRGLFKFFQE